LFCIDQTGVAEMGREELRAKEFESLRKTKVEYIQRANHIHQFHFSFWVQSVTLTNGQVMETTNNIPSNGRIANVTLNSIDLYYLISV
jgi:hypothetical protein